MSFMLQAFDLSLGAEASERELLSCGSFGRSSPLMEDMIDDASDIKLMDVLSLVLIEETDWKYFSSNEEVDEFLLWKKVKCWSKNFEMLEL